MLFARTTLLALTLAPALSVAAPSPREGLVVSVAWLAQHLKDPDLVLLHVGDKAEYDTAHIPGARFVSLRDVSASGAPEALTLELPPADVLREKLSALGVSDGSRIVVYFGKDWVSPTTRLIFTLDAAGWIRCCKPSKSRPWPSASGTTISPSTTQRSGNASSSWGMSSGK